jgi:hypothetical protein
MPSNPNNSLTTITNIHLNSSVLSQSNPNAEIQNLPNIQAIHSLPDPIQNPRPTKRTKRTTHTQPYKNIVQTLFGFLFRKSTPFRTFT